MKNPVFAYGSLDSLERAVERGKIHYPTYCWLRDTLQYAFVNKEGEIELVGIPKLTGTLDNQIILSDLKDGIYEIIGQHKIAESSETVYLAASYIFAIVATVDGVKKVRRITVDDIENFEVINGEVTQVEGYITSEYLVEHNYATEGYVDEMVAAMEISLKQELRDYVDDVVAEQVAALVPEEVQKYVDTVPASDVSDLFGI